MFTLGLLLGFAGLGQEPGSNVLASPIQPVVTAANETGFDMLRDGWTAEKGNVVCSPIEAQICLAACLIGAEPAVADGMRKAIHLDGPTLPMITDGFRRLCGQLERGPAVTRSAIWVPNPVSPLAGGFPTELIRISGDPETIVEEANRWASLATNGLVKKVLGPGSPRTTFLVTSAAAFEATWHERPTPLSGERGILFHPIEGEAVRVDSLFWHGQLGFARTTGAQAVLLPYQGERYGLIVIVPHADRTVDDVLSQLTAESLQKLRREMRPETMSVTLPKFSISTRLNLVGFLESHGAELACAPGNRFPDFAPGSHLKQVAHATMIEVDVRGTRAASATAAVGGGFGGGTTLTVDKPFVFLIHDSSTGANLFAGICARP